MYASHSTHKPVIHSFDPVYLLIRPSRVRKNQLYLGISVWQLCFPKYAFVEAQPEHAELHGKSFSNTARREWKKWTKDSIIKQYNLKCSLIPSQIDVKELKKRKFDGDEKCYIF